MPVCLMVCSIYLCKVEIVQRFLTFLQWMVVIALSSTQGAYPHNVSRHFRAEVGGIEFRLHGVTEDVYSEGTHLMVCVHISSPCSRLIEICRFLGLKPQFSSISEPNLGALPV